MVCVTISILFFTRPSPHEGEVGEGVMAFKPYSNKKEFKQLRKELRLQRTKAEELLWAYLRKKKTGFKFRRQYNIGNYIVDFYCHAAKLIIELDGFVHEDDVVFENDQSRQRKLEALGFKFLRFTNQQVYKNLENVWYYISDGCEKRVAELRNKITPSCTSPS